MKTWLLALNIYFHLISVPDKNETDWLRFFSYNNFSLLRKERICEVGKMINYSLNLHDWCKGALLVILHRRLLTFVMKLFKTSFSPSLNQMATIHFRLSFPRWRLVFLAPSCKLSSHPCQGGAWKRFKFKHRWPILVICHCKLATLERRQNQRSSLQSKIFDYWFETAWLIGEKFANWIRPRFFALVWKACICQLLRVQQELSTQMI